MNETAVQKRIVDDLTKMGVWVVRTAVSAKRSKNTARTGETGLPDLHVVSASPTSSVSGWIEVKKPGEDLSPGQVIWHAKARRRGINVGVATNSTEALNLVSLWLLGVTT